MPGPNVNPNLTRSQLVLEIASEMVASNGFAQAKVTFAPQGGRGTPVSFLSASTVGSLDAVLRREADLAIINPVAPLALAFRGQPPYSAPQPVRAIGVMPSEDQFVFAVRPELGLTRFEEIAERRVPLRVSLRGQPDHSLHMMLDHVVQAAGFTLDDLTAWGGAARREGAVPFPNSPKFQALVRGEIDAIFDEASDVWVAAALDAGMTILPLGEATVTRLEAMGYRRAYLQRALFPKLHANILTLDFSGWAVFVHAEASDELVTQICAALDTRQDRIAWEGGGALPIARMCREAPDTPQDVPLHPAAARYWRERGYVS
jgi:TRAP-type uncharacterized transport system substrate-binding protein